MGKLASLVDPGNGIGTTDREEAVFLGLGGSQIGCRRIIISRQPSTLYFLNQACIWFQPSSAASLR